jgi:hypothetical protein
MSGRLFTTGNALWLVVLGALASASAVFAGAVAVGAVACTFSAAALWFASTQQKKALGDIFPIAFVGSFPHDNEGIA